MCMYIIDLTHEFYDVEQKKQKQFLSTKDNIFAYKVVERLHLSTTSWGFSRRSDL